MKLIMRADDLGISEGVNLGIEKAVRHGMITCVGLMPNMVDAKHGFNLIKDLDVCLGQHSNICLGKPLSNPKLIPSLVDENGEFYTSSIINHRKIDTISIKECEIELEAQLKRFIEITGKNPDYFEGHAVFSIHYLQAIENVAKKYHLYYVNPMDPKWVEKNGIHGLGMIPLNEQGLYNPYDYFDSHLDDIQNNDCTIAVFHPGYLDQYILEHSSYTLIRTKECEFLCSQWLIDWIAKHQIELVDFKNYRKQNLCKKQI